MSITVGTNSYLTVDEFKAWADSRLNSYSDFSNEQIEAALVKSSLDYIDPNFTFKGTKLDAAQAMNLPTDEVAISDILNGAAQAAWQALNGELFISPTANSAGQLKRNREKLDVLETEVEYAENTAYSYTHDTTQIRKLLSKYLAGGGGVKSLRY